MVLANTANTVTLTNVEGITGGTSTDIVTLGTAYTSGSIDLGSGADTLTSATSPTALRC